MKKLIEAREALISALLKANEKYHESDASVFKDIINPIAKDEHGFFLSHRTSFQLYFISRVYKPVQNGVSQSGIAYQVMPFIDRELACNQRRGDGVSVLQDLKKVMPVASGGVRSL